jgi:hypothetical protein
MHKPPAPSAKPAIVPAANPPSPFRLSTNTGRFGRDDCSSSRFEGSSLLWEGAAVVDPGSVVGSVPFVGSSVGDGGIVSKASVGNIVLVSSTAGDSVGIESRDGDEEGSRFA